MPQPKKSSGSSSRSSSRSAKPAAKKPASASAKKPASASKPKTAAKKPANAGRKPAARTSKPSGQSAAAKAAEAADAREDALKVNLAQLRELLAGGIVLTPQRLQETLDEAVSRGRMVRQDAEELTRTLLSVGRSQTQDLLADLESIVGKAKDTASDGGDGVLRQVDKARRLVGAGPTFPILGYDDLAAAQVTRRLKDLSPAELRKVRDYERRNANRVSVLKAIEKELA